MDWLRRLWRAVASERHVRLQLQGPLALEVRPPRKQDPEIPYTGCFWQGAWWKGRIDGVPFAMHPVEVARGRFRDVQIFVGPFDYDWNTAFTRKADGALVHEDPHLPPRLHPALACAEVAPAVAALSTAVVNLSLGYRAVACSKYTGATPEMLVADLRVLARLAKALAARTDPPLVGAVERGDGAAVERLLAEGASGDEPGPFEHGYRAFGVRGYKVPIQLAADLGDVRAARALLEAGAGARHLALSLAFAIEHGNEELVRLLAGKVERLDESVWLPIGVRDEYASTTALALACRKGDLALVRLLLEAGANPDPSGVAISPSSSASGSRKEAIRDALEAARRSRRAADGRLSLAPQAAGALSIADASGGESGRRRG